VVIIDFFRGEKEIERKKRRDREGESDLHTFVRCLQMPTASLEA
jgi:hypothetical protein